MSRPGASVLYDAPGPRTRRRILLGSVVAAVLAAAALALVAARLQEQGQFERELWAPLFDPSDELFPRVWEIILGGFRLTLEAAFYAVLASSVVGLLLAVLRLSLGRWARLPVVGLIEVLRGLPVVVSIFYTYTVMRAADIDLANLWYLVIGLTLYNSVVIAEIIRAGVQALPRGQTEAALAVGLTPGQTLRLVQLPQALRIMLPALISQLVVIVKDTALAGLVLAGFEEALNSGQRIYQDLDNPIQVYLVIGLIFIAINFMLGKLAEYLERRASRSTTEKEAVQAVERQATQSGLAA